MRIVANVDFDLTRQRMLKSVAEELASYVANFFLDDRRQCTPLAFYNHAELGRVATRILWREIASHRREALCKVGLRCRFMTQALNSASAFCDCLLGSADCAIQSSYRVLSPPRKHVARCLKLKQQSVQALQ